MNKIFSTTDVGRKNITFGILLFLILGVAAGIPLTIDMFGGSLLGGQYQTWKVIHAYGVFLSFINFFFGLCIDRLQMPRQQKQIASWAFLLAGTFGGYGRMLLLLLSALDVLGRGASLFESIFFVLGTYVFVRGQLTQAASSLPSSARSLAAQRGPGRG